MSDDNVGLATPILAAGTLAVWLGLEVYYVQTKRPTISDQLVAFNRDWPTFGVLFSLVTGLLMGHWFWRR